MKTKLAFAVCVILVAFVGWRVWSFAKFSGGRDIPVGKPVVDIETGHRFTIKIDRDFKGWPVESPKTGKLTGYPAEICYWNQCKELDGGTWVVLNSMLGKEGSTHCPVCGHVVIGHNPPPPDFYTDDATAVGQGAPQPAEEPKRPPRPGSRNE